MKSIGTTPEKQGLIEAPVVFREVGYRVPAGKQLLLAQAEAKTTSRLGPATIEIEKGSVVEAVIAPHSLSILNLHDERRHAVQLVINGQRYSIGPGQEFVISNDKSALAVEHNAIPGRRLQKVASVEDFQFYMADFSMAEAIRGLNGLGLMSTGSKDMKIKRDILKTAVCVQQVSSRHGMYQTFSRRDFE